MRPGVRQRTGVYRKETLRAERYRCNREEGAVRYERERNNEGDK